MQKRATVTAAITLLILSSIALAGAAPQDDYNVPGKSSATAATRDVDPGEIMERLASAQQIEEYRKSHPEPFWVFTESRDLPVRRFDAPPEHWLKRSSNAFHGVARPGEFYVFQIGVYAPTQDVGQLFLTGGFPKLHWRCINLEGTGPAGQHISKPILLQPRRVQPLWVIVELPINAKGTLSGEFEVRAGRDTPPVKIPVTIDVEGEAVSDGGDSQPQHLSRLRWLDSTIGQQATVTAPFTPVMLRDREISVLGRSVSIGDFGLPQQLTSFFNSSNTRITTSGRELLAGPMQLVAETDTGILRWKSEDFEMTANPVGATWSAVNTADGLTCTVTGEMGYDGIAKVHMSVVSDPPKQVRDLRLEIPLHRDVAEYFMGLGQRGGLRPAGDLHWKWDTSKFQDALWIGDVNAGMQVRFKSGDYARPLVNIYYPFSPLHRPLTWGNDGKGGIDVVEDGNDRVFVRAYAGPCTVRGVWDFNFELYLTPFKPINTEAQWSQRYIHPKEHADNAAMEKVFTMLGPGGPNVVNIHQATPFEPYINYPYFAGSVDALKDYVTRLHAKNVRAKIYYTTREITNHMPELWALNSLRGEVIFPGPGKDAKTVVNKNGPDPWLIEHLRENFIPAWRTHVPPPYDDMDISVITTPDTRWNNFYLQGLAWLCENVDLDGIYIDDTALDRTSLQRARRILDKRPGRLIDLHSWNHLKALGSFANCAIIYMELFPYIDRIWFGEGFNYDETPPDYWLVEMSGIPYGLMSEMLQKGGNPWLGTLYGMTTRLGWSGDPRPIWKTWDDFGMAGSEMIGYWDPACPVHTDKQDVLVTVYRQKDRAMLAVGNFSDKPQSVKLNIDWAALGVKADGVKLRAPQLEKFQNAGTFSPDDELTIDAKRGLILMLGEGTR